ncbi:MAG: Eco57I restriction-modification methylase domain-containing protein [Phycisphaeraceae bacterium]|nr:Eco57I restriction-modification methylase domain-containing protein [Phycisphaeraceae bacterium]
MAVDLVRTRGYLNDFAFGTLFIEELGWSRPTSRQAVTFEAAGIACQRKQIAQLAGVVVLEVTSADGRIPDAGARRTIHNEIAKLHHENLLIFVDKDRTQSLWSWVKRQDGKSHPRDHHFFKGQPGDLFVSKLTAMVFDISDFDDSGNVRLVEVARRLKSALDVERVTKRFYAEFKDVHDELVTLITGIPDERQRRWYASILLNRLMFIYFLQRKGFLDFKNPAARDGNQTYLQDKLAQSQKAGPDRFYTGLLSLLFFEGFAKPEDKRSADARKRLGNIRYLNGGLFLIHPIERDNPDIGVPDAFFRRLFELFGRYSWNLNDTPGGDDQEINPDVLGYIFEKYINQKAFGAYYTRPEITEYLCERTIHQLVLDAINTPPGMPAIPGVKQRRYESIADLLMDLDAQVCRRLLSEVLPSLSLLDPACGSGAFLVAAMRTLINIYSAVIGRIKFLSDRELTASLTKTEREHPNLSYYIKKRIITDNLFGVDIMEEATEIARLRLFLALVASAETVTHLEPLPNIDFNILPGNSLIGMMRIDDKRFEARNKKGALGGLLFQQKTYREILDEKNRLIDTYRRTTTYAADLSALRDDIDQKKRACTSVLDEMLLDEFESLGIKFEQATWDAAKSKPGKPVKRSLTIDDIQAQRPFHWGFEFDRVLNERGGFDAIITNPPWEMYQTDEKEFFQEYLPTIKKKALRIEDWKKQFASLMRDSEMQAAWLSYASGFSHTSKYFKSAVQYRNQLSLDTSGKQIASKINLYKLFTEQCFNLLRKGGLCGIVIPSGIYTDLGAKQLREMLFNETRITALFGFENRKEVFEGVHRSFKFVVLSFQRGGTTDSFPAAFMRHDVAELDRFPEEGAIPIDIDLVRRLSPDSLSVMEFKCETDVTIAKKMLRFPLLGEEVDGAWKVALTQEFNMTSDSHLFRTSPGKGRLPLYEGKMIWQFDHRLAEPRYWVDEKQGRAALSGRAGDSGQRMDYQSYRLGFRDIAANTNERTMVSTVIPPAFHGNKIPTVCPLTDDDRKVITDAEQLFLAAVFNSFPVDFVIRMKVTTTLNFFYVYQIPVPRLTEKDTAFAPIVERAARLICTTPEFDNLAMEVGLKGHQQGVTDQVERARLRAELDGLIAHLYGLTEEEFAHILTTFPIVPDPVKVAARNAYRDVARGAVR